jgi:hypothetical protein
MQLVSKEQQRSHRNDSNTRSSNAICAHNPCTQVDAHDASAHGRGARGAHDHEEGLPEQCRLLEWDPVRRARPSNREKVAHTFLLVPICCRWTCAEPRASGVCTHRLSPVRCRHNGNILQTEAKGPGRQADRHYQRLQRRWKKVKVEVGGIARCTTPHPHDRRQTRIISSHHISSIETANPRKWGNLL